jgi:hypothetical protein
MGIFILAPHVPPTLARRLAGHVKSYKQHLNEKYDYITSFDIIKNGDYDIVLLKSCPCESKDQLHARERYYIESLDCLNQIIPGRTNKEYYNLNKDKICNNTSNIGKTTKKELKYVEESFRVGEQIACLGVVRWCGNHSRATEIKMRISHHLLSNEKIQQQQKQYHNLKNDKCLQ